MKLDAKNKWVEALRSGRYQQAKGNLFKPDEGYCCLGVLTDLYLKEHGISTGNHEGDIKTHSQGYTNGIPNQEVEDWAGLNYNDTGELAEMNDGGDTFSTIAAYIEENL